MIGSDEIARRFEDNADNIPRSDPNLTKHQTILAQFKAFANYLDTELPDGDEKERVMTLLDSASMESHLAVGYTETADEHLPLEVGDGDVAEAG